MATRIVLPVGPLALLLGFRCVDGLQADFLRADGHRVAVDDPGIAGGMQHRGGASAPLPWLKWRRGGAGAPRHQPDFPAGGCHPLRAGLPDAALSQALLFCVDRLDAVKELGNNHAGPLGDRVGAGAPDLPRTGNLHMRAPYQTQHTRGCTSS